MQILILVPCHGNDLSFAVTFNHFLHSVYYKRSLKDEKLEFIEVLAVFSAYFMGEEKVASKSLAKGDYKEKFCKTNGKKCFPEIISLRDFL